MKQQQQHQQQQQQSKCRRRCRRRGIQHHQYPTIVVIVVSIIVMVIVVTVVIVQGFVVVVVPNNININIQKYNNNHHHYYRRTSSSSSSSSSLLLLQHRIPSPLTSTTTTTTTTTTTILFGTNNNNNNPENESLSYNLPIKTTTNTSSNKSTSNTIQEWIRMNNNILFLGDDNGIELNIDLIVIMVIYFVEGGLGLARLGQTYLLKDEIQLGPAELSAITGFFILPWTIKPIYGFLSDTVPLFGYKRKSYLIICGIISCISYLLLSYQGIWDNIPSKSILSLSGTVFLLLLSSACIAFSDVVADGIIVTKTRLMAQQSQQQQIQKQQQIQQQFQQQEESSLLSSPDSITKTKTPTTTSSNNDGSLVVTSTGTNIEVVNNNNNNKIENGGGNGGTLQSLCWGSSAFGSLLAAYYSGALLEHLPTRTIFAITAILPLIVAILAFSINEDKQQQVNIVQQDIVVNEDVTTSTLSLSSTTDNNSLITNTADTITVPSSPLAVIPSSNASLLSFFELVQQQGNIVIKALQQPAIYKPIIFVFLWQATPTSGGAFFYFLTNELHFQPELLGRLQLASAIATIVGVYLYNTYFQKISIPSILYWTTILSFPLGVIPPVLLISRYNIQLGIPDEILMYGDDVALAALGQISFLPTLVLAAQLCPVGIEAVFFATIMSIYNLAGTVGTELGAILTKLAGITETNFTNLIPLTIFCNITSLLPLLLLHWLIPSSSEELVEEEGTMETNVEGQNNIQQEIIISDAVSDTNEPKQNGGI